MEELAILGKDFLEKFKAIFNFGKNELVICDQGSEYIINFIKNIQTSKRKILSCIVKTENKTRIKAYSECLVKIKTPELLQNHDLLFEPNTPSIKDLYKGIVWAKIVSTTNENGEMFESVLNANEEDAVIELGTEIGRVSKADYVDEDYPEDLIGRNQEINFDKININKKLNSDEATKLTSLITKFKSIFQWSEYDTGLKTLTEHRIKTKDTELIK